MNLNTFIQEYGQYVRYYKEYENNDVIMIKFNDPGKIMWLKGILREKLNLQVKMANVGRTYWFEPID